MTRVDQLYIDKAKEIIEFGFNEKDVKNNNVRPYWDDFGKKTSAYTIYLPQQVIEYNEGETPLTSLRKIPWKTAIKELLWIYKDKDNNVDNLREKYNVKYWEEWKNEENTLGTAYGYQMNKKFISPENGKMIDQVDRLIEEIKENPLNRRLFTLLIDFDDISEMTLVPCAFMTLWTVTEDRLNLTLIQRSGDYLAAAGPGCINAFQYYTFMRMIAQVTGYKPGKFVHFIQNLHIYDRHIPIVKEIIKQDTPKDGPILKINPEVDNFYDFTIDDFELVNYNPDTTKYDIQIAI